MFKSLGFGKKKKEEEPAEKSVASTDAGSDPNASSSGNTEPSTPAKEVDSKDSSVGGGSATKEKQKKGGFMGMFSGKKDKDKNKNKEKDASPSKEENSSSPDKEKDTESAPTDAASPNKVEEEKEKEKDKEKEKETPTPVKEEGEDPTSTTPSEAHMNTSADPMESKDPLNSIPEEGKSEGASDNNDKSVEPEGGDVGKNLKEGSASVDKQIAETGVESTKKDVVTGGEEVHSAPSPAQDAKEASVAEPSGSNGEEIAKEEDKHRGRKGRESKKEEEPAAVPSTAETDGNYKGDPSAESQPEPSTEPDLSEIAAVTEHFRSCLSAAIGTEVYTQFMEVCKSLEEQSNLESSRGELEFDQFLQVVQAFKVADVSDAQLQVVFSNFCHFSEEMVPVLDYEKFMHNLRFVRSENDLLDVVKSCITELAKSDRAAEGKLEHYFAHFESDKRDAARSMAADEDRLVEYDLASYDDFKKAVRALGVGFHEVEVTKLFCALRSSEQVSAATILKAVESGGQEDGARDVGNALLNLFALPEKQPSLTSSSSTSSFSSRRKKGEKKGQSSGPPMRGLRDPDQLLADFREAFDLIKRVLSLPQPTNSAQCWHIAGQLLSKTASRAKVPPSSVSTVSGAVLMAFIKDFAWLAISVPKHFHAMDSVINVTSGELRRLFNHLNSSCGAPEDWKTHAAGNNDLRESDFLSFSALATLLDFPRDEGLFIRELRGDIHMERLVAMAASRLKLPHPVVDAYGEKSFVCTIKTVLVDKDAEGKETEVEELWSTRVSIPPPAEDAPEGQGLVWEAKDKVLPVGVTLEEAASQDSRWRLVLEFLEVNTAPSAHATLTSVAGEVAAASQEGAAPSAEPAGAEAPTPTPAPAGADAKSKATYFLARRSFTYLDILLRFVSAYSAESDAASIRDGLQVSVGFGEEASNRSEAHVAVADLEMDTVLARMMTGPIRREPSQSSSANTLAAVRGELSNQQYLVSDMVTALLTRSKREAPEVVAKPISKRKAQRQQAERQGHLGGKSVLTKGVASTKIQSLWRSKKVRRWEKKKMFAAIAIQSAYRGSSQRSKFKKTLSSKLYEKSLEDAHKRRVKSLRSKERELLLIKQIPGSEFLNFDRMRKDGSAKVIQRAFRRKSVAKGFAASASEGAAPGSPARETEQAAARRAHGKALVSHISDNTRLNKLDGVHADKVQPLHLDTDAIGLAQLQRRIKDEVSSKGSSGGRAGSLESMTAFHSMQQKVRRDRGVRGASSVRESYKDLSELQRKAGTLVGGYLANREDINARKTQRLQTLANIRQLASELKDLPSLADAKKVIGSVKTRSTMGETKEETKRQMAQESWYTSVPLQTLPVAVDKHLGTVDAMDSKSSWGTVASPHDMTGPPINISELAQQDNSRLFTEVGNKGGNMRRGLASAWLKGSDEDHSLLWVSYSAQPSKLGKKGQPKPRADGDDDAADSAESKLDEYHPVLAKLVRESMQVSKRRDLISKLVKQDKRKLDDMATAYSNQSIALMNKHRAGQIAKGLTEMERERKHVAATRIQSAQRRKTAKARVESLRAEKRVMAALSVLMTELRRPELRPETKQNLVGLSNVPIDAKMIELMHRQGHGQEQGQTQKRRPVPPQRGALSPAQVPLAPRQAFIQGMGHAAPSRSPDHSLDVSAMTEKPTPARPSRGGVTLLVPEDRDEGIFNAPSPGSVLPRTPVGNPSTRDSAIQGSRLSVATEGTVRGAMESFEAGGSGVGYVSSPGETLSQSAVSTTLFSSPGPTNAHYAPLVSDRARKAMEKVSDDVSGGSVSVEGIVSSALTANPTNFRKDGAFAFLGGLVSACGSPTPISLWLKGHSVAGDKAALEVRTAGLLLGALARELNLLDDENEGPYLLIQGVLLLRLLAASWDDGCVPVHDLSLLLEDNWGGGSKSQVIHYMNAARFDITQLANLRSQTAEELFDDAVAKEPALQRSGSALISLSVEQVGELLVRLSPSALEGPQQRQLAEHLVSLTTGDATGIIYVSEVKSALCCAPGTDFVQNRLQTYFRAAPSLFDSLTEQMQVRLQRHLNESKVREAVAASDLPLSGVEVLIVANMIVSIADDTEGATAGVLAVLQSIKNRTK